MSKIRSVREPGSGSTTGRLRATSGVTGAGALSTSEVLGDGFVMSPAPQPAWKKTIGAKNASARHKPAQVARTEPPFQRHQTVNVECTSGVFNIPPPQQ